MNRKSVAISGAASGIGLATAKLYASKGYYVGLFDINEEGLIKANKEIGEDISFYQVVDITDEENVKVAMENFMKETNGRLDALIANAGIVYMGHYEDRSLDFYKKLIDINTYGVLTQINAGLPYLKETAKSSIIITSSASSVTGTPLFTVYSGTKHFTRAITEALNIEFEKYDIFVGNVMPSFVKTKMVDHVREEGYKGDNLNLLSPENIANEIYKLSTKRKKISVVIGEFKKLAIMKKLVSELTMKSIVKKNIYDEHKNKFVKN